MHRQRTFIRINVGLEERFDELPKDVCSAVLI
jgi:hypothetical protein